MKTEEEVKDLIKKARHSTFSKQGVYQVNIKLNKLETFLSSIKLYSDQTNSNVVSINTVSFFNKITPGFQRDNNKWSLDMKIKFVQNLLSGVETDLKLFSLDGKDFQIIDGLQRLTAIIDFMENKFNIFGDFTYEDLKNNLITFNTHLTVTAYIFENWFEVGKYYIEINENITHTKEDIDKAKVWFKTNHNIIF